MNIQLPLFQFEKRCTKCGETKPATADYFPRRGDYPNSLASWCKVCTYAYQKRWSKDNPDKTKATQNRYRNSHLELTRERSRVYHSTHKTYMAAKQREFRQRHPEKYREYYAKNPQRYRQKAIDYRRNNPERSKEKQREYSRVRREREKRAEGKYSIIDVIVQYNRQEGLCFWCSCELTKEIMHVDHIIPLSRFGTNWPANIVCCCETCNSSKHDFLPFDEWSPPNPLRR